MIRVVAAFVLVAAGCAPASAQTFANYLCGDGKPLAAAFFPGERAVRVQVDGKALKLKQRIAASGARYSGSGVTFRLKGTSAMLKRRGQSWLECKPA